MFTLTESARTELDAFFADKEKSAIRLYLAPGGCSGPRIGLALDEPNERDFVTEQDGYTFCATKELWATIGGAKVDASPMGFLVTPEIPLPNMGGGCGCSSCGYRHLWRRMPPLIPSNDPGEVPEQIVLQNDQEAESSTRTELENNARNFADNFPG